MGWVGYTFSFILHLKVTNGELASIGMDDKQWTELPDGSKGPKFCMTHDQSFNTSIGMSENGRFLTDQLDPLYYGGCLSHIIHYIVLIRLRHPNIKILGGKSDIKATYRRISLNGNTAEKCTIMLQGLGLTSLRLTFAGSPCPNEFVWHLNFA
jgi:hypothetical protein